MLISVITVSFNAADTITDTIESVLSQSHDNIEYIVVDGASTDETKGIIESYSDDDVTWVSGPDDGIYDAMNKGISMATGAVVGFLNADDVFASNDVLSRVACAMESTSCQACYGDVVFVKNDLKTVTRYYSSKGFSPKKLAYGWMPAHPSLYLRRELFEQYGKFKTNYLIAADYELVVRLFAVHRINYRYISHVLVKMRVGGVSTKSLRNRLILNREIVRGCNENGIKTNLFKVLMKFPFKIMEMILRPL